MSDSPSPPPAPDYVGAANATAAGNEAAARVATKANRVDQYTPYGSLTYAHTGTDPDAGWSQTMKLAPEQQTLLNQQNQTSIGLGNLEQEGLGYVSGALSHPLTASDLPAPMVNAGETGQDAMMRRFQPMIDQNDKALETQLANQGIARGSEAYDNAMRTQTNSDDDLRSQAVLHGFDVGDTAQTHGLQMATALRDLPINELNAVRTGAQVTNPSFAAVPQQGQTAGPDLMGAAQGQNQYNMGLYNSQVASNNSTMGSIGGLLGTGAMAAATAY